MTVRVVRGAAVAVAGVFAAVGMVTVPVVAALVWVVLGVVVGVLIGAWLWLTDPVPGGWDVAVRGGVCAVIGGLALAGMSSVLGSATVAVISTSYAVAVAVVGWRSRRGFSHAETALLPGVRSVGTHGRAPGRGHR